MSGSRLARNDSSSFCNVSISSRNPFRAFESAAYSLRARGAPAAAATCSRRAKWCMRRDLRSQADNAKKCDSVGLYPTWATLPHLLTGARATDHRPEARQGGTSPLPILGGSRLRVHVGSTLPLGYRWPQLSLDFHLGRLFWPPHFAFLHWLDRDPFSISILRWRKYSHASS